MVYFWIEIPVYFWGEINKRKNITSKIKVEIVLSLLRGEDPELVSREYGVTLADINLWRDQFIESGADGFKRKPDDSKLIAAERKIGQLQMELELTKKKNELAAKLKRR
jgi:hypothetical protein